MDNVVTTTFAFEGNGIVREYVGGYADWIRQRPAPLPPPATARVADRRPSADADNRGATAVASKKLSYKEQPELDALPREIEALETEKQALNVRIAGPDFYKEGAPRSPPRWCGSRRSPGSSARPTPAGMSSSRDRASRCFPLTLPF